MRGAHRDVWCSKGTTLDRSGAFRSGTLPPCTVWPRTVMRGESRKVNSGHNSVPKSARRTEPSPRNPRFAARPQGVAAQRKVRGVKRGQETILGVLSPFVPAGEHRHSPAAEGGHCCRALRGRNFASSGAPLYRRNRLPSAEGKRGAFAALRRNILHCAAGFDMMKIPERGRII